MADINKLIKQMNEAKAKYLKGIDKPGLQKIKEIAAGNGPAKSVVTEILDGIAKFVANDVNAVMRSGKGDLFDTVETFSKEVKDCFPADRDRQWLQGVAKNVNMDVDGNKGAILAAISDPNNAQDMVHVFPFFKILYKLAQLGMTITKRISLQRQVAEKSKAMEDSQVEMEKQKAIVKNLEFHQRVNTEVQRASD